MCADHIVAVYQGGGLCDLENLRTLCVICHQVSSYTTAVHNIVCFIHTELSDTCDVSARGTGGGGGGGPPVKQNSEQKLPSAWHCCRMCTKIGCHVWVFEGMDGLWR